MSNDRLETLRRELDVLDDALVDLLADRQDAVRRVAEVKASSDAPLRDAAREAELISRLTARAKARGLDDLFVARLFREVIDLSVRTQEMHLGVSARSMPVDTTVRPGSPGSPWTANAAGRSSSMTTRPSAPASR